MLHRILPSASYRSTRKERIALLGSRPLRPSHERCHGALPDNALECLVHDQQRKDRVDFSAHDLAHRTMEVELG